MPRQHFLPDGGFVTVPDTMSWDEADAKAQQKFPEAFGVQQKHGFYEATKAGANRGVGAGLRGLGDLTGSSYLKTAGHNVLAPDTTLGAYRPTTEQDVAKADEKGMLAGLGARYNQYIGEPTGDMIGRYAIPTAVGAGAAMLAPKAGLFGLGAAGTAALVRGAGFVASDFPMEQGENIERREQVVAETPPGQTPPQFDETNTVMASLAQAALMPVFGAFGTAGMKYFKLMGPDLAGVTKQVMTGQISKEAGIELLNSTAKNIAARSLEAAAVGAPMMVGTEALRTAQSGEDATGAPAMGRYGEGLTAAVAFAPIGGVLGGMGRRGQVKKVERASAEHARREEMDQAVNEGIAKRAADFEATPEGQTQDMGFGVPKEARFPELQREQQVLEYLREQKASAAEIKEQQRVVKALETSGPTSPDQVPTVDRAFFNAAGIANVGEGKKIRDTFEGMPLNDPEVVTSLHQALVDHANSKKAPTGTRMHNLESAIQDLNMTQMRTKFDAANKLYAETGNDAPLREILNQSKEQPGYHAPLFPEEGGAPHVQKPTRPATNGAGVPADVPKPSRAGVRVRPTTVSAGVERVGPVNDRLVVGEEPGASALKEAPVEPAPKVRGKNIDMTEEAFGKKAKESWETERDNSAAYPGYDQLHPDAKDMLHARIEERAVDRNGNRDINKVAVTGADMRAVKQRDRESRRKQEVQEELGGRGVEDPDSAMYLENEKPGARAPRTEQQAGRTEEINRQHKNGESSVAEVGVLHAINEGRVADALKAIVQDKDATVAERQLAAQFDANKIYPKISMENNLKVGDKGEAHGAYTSKDEVQLNSNAVWNKMTPKNTRRVFMHEMTHAATVGALHRAEAVLKKVREGKLLDPAERAYRRTREYQAASRLHELHNELFKRTDYKEHYGAKNVREMVAEAFTNPKFQKYLAGIEYKPSGSAITNTWKELVASIKKLLGFDAVSNSALEHALTEGAALVSERAPGKDYSRTPGKPDYAAAPKKEAFSKSIPAKLRVTIEREGAGGKVEEIEVKARATMREAERQVNVFEALRNCLNA